MDGVLSDTTDLHYQTWHAAFADFGIDLQREQFLPFFGRSPTITLDGLLGPEIDAGLRQKIRNRKISLFNEAASSMLLPTPGVLNWLEFFSYHCVQAVASSAPLENITLILDKLNIRKYFQSIVSGTEMCSKPDPFVFLRAAKELSASPKTCLIIEDSPSGIEAAKRARIPVIAICTSNHAAQLNQADIVLPDLSELSVEIFQKFCQNHY